MFATWAMKLLQFVFPKILQELFDFIEYALQSVADAEALADSSARRDHVIAQLRLKTGQFIPDVVLRVIMELCCVLLALGVTAEKLETMEQLVLGENIANLWDEASRADIVNKFFAMFPDTPERVVRLLLEFALIRVGK